jgi:hypothetical protein
MDHFYLSLKLYLQKAMRQFELFEDHQGRRYRQTDYNWINFNYFARDQWSAKLYSDEPEPFFIGE